MKAEQVETSRKILGSQTVDMLLQVHEDALWMLENMGVGCAQPNMLAAFQRYEDSGKAIVYENRVYVTEDLVSQYLYTAGVPDPDLIIRTSGELRGSNFLIWQGAYAEWHFTPTFWPNFDREELRIALEEYGQRQRRFGRTGLQLKSK